MDALIKTVLGYARYLRERDVDAGGDRTGRDQDKLMVAASVRLAQRGIKEMTERGTIDTPEDRALSRAIFKKIDELRSRRHLMTDEAARRSITDHINVLVKKLAGAAQIDFALESVKQLLRFMSFHLPTYYTEWLRSGGCQSNKTR